MIRRANDRLIDQVAVQRIFRGIVGIQSEVAVVIMFGCGYLQAGTLVRLSLELVAELTPGLQSGSIDLKAVAIRCKLIHFGIEAFLAAKFRVAQSLHTELSQPAR